MTREYIEQAAAENNENYGRIFNPVDFAIQQVNAALEEAENAAAIAIGKGLRATDVVLAIRALKIEP
jgi:cystathionine beta-lyase/cystathionine gamma-synthase